MSSGYPNGPNVGAMSDQLIEYAVALRKARRELMECESRLIGEQIIYRDFIDRVAQKLNVVTACEDWRDATEEQKAAKVFGRLEIWAAFVYSPSLKRREKRCDPEVPDAE